VGEGGKQKISGEGENIIHAHHSQHKRLSGKYKKEKKMKKKGRSQRGPFKGKTQRKGETRVSPNGIVTEEKNPVKGKRTTIETEGDLHIRVKKSRKNFRGGERPGEKKKKA